jgi:hypothetical protein
MRHPHTTSRAIATALRTAHTALHTGGKTCASSYHLVTYHRLHDDRRRIATTDPLPPLSSSPPAATVPTSPLQLYLLPTLQNAGISTEMSATTLFYQLLTWSLSQPKSHGSRVLFDQVPLLHVAPDFGDAMLTRSKRSFVQVLGALHHVVSTWPPSSGLCPRDLQSS